MFKKALFLGIVSGILAGIASVIYSRVYSNSTGASFFKVASPTSMLLASLIGGILAAIGYWAIIRMLRKNGEIVFNLLFVILSFATMLPAFGVKLPLDMSEPELFPGMVIPMHFFPVLAWLTLKPLFFRQQA